MYRTIFILMALLSLNVHATDEAARKTLQEDAKVLKELSPMPEIKKWLDGDSGIPKQYPQQPPLIPHPTKGYVLNLKANKCLTCHSKENAPESGARPVPDSHYVDREGKTGNKIAGRRYFCVQCHVPQTDSEPLMTNDFKVTK